MHETAARTERRHSLVATLDLVAGIVESAGARTIGPEERAKAQTAALAWTQSDAHDPVSHSAAAVSFAASLLGDIVVDLAADTSAAQRLVTALEERAGLPAAAIGHELLRSLQVSQLPIDVALQVQLSLLLVFTGARSVSVWTSTSGETPRRLELVGDVQAGAIEVERGAAGLLKSAPRRRWCNEGGCTGVLVERGELPAAALIEHGSHPERASKTDLLLGAAAPVIGAILDRGELLAAGATDRPSIISALERRLARLRYDLHDGPLQDLHLLALDLRLFRDQVAPMVHDHPDAGRLLGRLDDLEAQLVALDSELRHISTTMQSPFLPAGTLPEALTAITETFASRSGIRPEVDLSGNLAALTDSQQIALLALIREGLNNVHKHSGAHGVTITIAAHAEGVDAVITDDGRGFDPEETLVRAAREGHLGVVGIHERVRMLGGRARIESRPGGPTVISVSLPYWNAGD